MSDLMKAAVTLGVAIVVAIPFLIYFSLFTPARERTTAGSPPRRRVHALRQHNEDRTAFLLLALLSKTAAAKGFYRGGHRVTGGGFVTLNASPSSYALAAMPQPEWMTAHDRELWDKFVYNTYDSHSTNAGPLERRRTSSATHSAYGMWTAAPPS